MRQYIKHVCYYHHHHRSYNYTVHTNSPPFFLPVYGIRILQGKRGKKRGRARKVPGGKAWFENREHIPPSFIAAKE